MKIPLKTRLLLFREKKRFNIEFPGSKPLAFRRDGSGFSSIAIIFPENEKDCRTAHYFMKSVLDKPEVEIVVFAREPFTYSSEIEEKVQINLYSDEDFNWLGGLKETSRKRLFDKNFDAILDLNPGLNQQSAMLTHYSGSQLRIGFKSEHSHNFFNIEVNHKPGTFLERGYESFRKLLDL